MPNLLGLLMPPEKESIQNALKLVNAGEKVLNNLYSKFESSMGEKYSGEIKKQII